MGIDLLAGVIGGLVFLAAVVAHVVVRRRLRPEDEEDVYWECQEQDPRWQRYERWSQRTIVWAVIGMLLLFLGWVF